MYLFKKYVAVEHKTDKSNFIKFTISFNKDTYHWATSSTKEKGYQLIATPIKQETINENILSESFTAFKGFYKIIYPIERQSSKRLEEAIKLFEEKEEEEYLKFFTEKGFKLIKKEEKNGNKK